MEQQFGNTILTQLRKKGQRFPQVYDRNSYSEMCSRKRKFENERLLYWEATKGSGNGYARKRITHHLCNNRYTTVDVATAARKCVTVTWCNNCYFEFEFLGSTSLYGIFTAQIMTHAEVVWTNYVTTQLMTHARKVMTRKTSLYWF